MHLPLQLRTRALSTHLKGPRFHTLHRLTQNEVFAALPPPRPSPVQESCAGFPEIMPTPGLGSLPAAAHLPEAYQPGLSEEQGGPLRTCCALCCQQQGPDHGVPVPSLLRLLRRPPDSNRGSADALALQLTMW